ncbi:unnamed protein product [Periconia digitata]|uniref:Uncharacterized protein n=1 Tax=Periconia digitata TaxID=1303443 RepID=A0A9W4XV32_9PLEO|nr:unnamed protein product [Periconia digitata]
MASFYINPSPVLLTTPQPTAANSRFSVACTPPSFWPLGMVHLARHNAQNVHLALSQIFSIDSRRMQYILWLSSSWPT